MDTTQHYSSLVYHPHPPQPHSISDSAPPQSYPQDMAWQVPHHSPPNSSASGHAHIPPMMNHSQEHVEYAPHSAQQSFLSRHPHDPFSQHHPPSPSVDSGPSSNTMSFESPQIPSSIGPDRGPSRRRLRPPGRVQSHGEIPDFAMPEAHDTSHYPSHQGSRPQTPNVPGAPDQFVQVSEQARLPFHSPTGVYGRHPPFQYTQPQSRSTSGSATSAASNPRSASPALSVASVLTSVSSSASAPASVSSIQPHPVSGIRMCPVNLTAIYPQHKKEPSKKKRLYNTDRREICMYAREHPGTKQEDIAHRFGVERSTVSKILKQRHRWLAVAVDEDVQIAKLRPSKFPDLECRLAEWVKTVSKNGTVLSDALLRQRAREIGDSQGYTPDKFKASSGWLENFKHRHGIRRGMWTGTGTNDIKARAYAEDFKPPEPEEDCPPGPFNRPASPLEEGPSHSEYNMGLDENGQQSSSSHHGVQAMHPSSLTLQPAWPRSDEQASNGESSTLMYPPENQPQYEMQQDSVADGEQPVAEAALPRAEPIPIPVNPENGADGEQVYVMPVMPEVLEVTEVPDDAEAEKALDKVLAYVRANHGELEIQDAGFQLLVELKYKLFGKATGQPYDPRYLPKHVPT
ncbi:CenpB-DNA-bind-domain-containing protein [Trametes cingulata]|nr:CenpB-DNA-bind-domain-containing protein [Trametes cingulata]